MTAAERTAYGRQTDRALPALAGALTPDELMLQLVEGRLRRASTALFAVTSARVVFLPASRRAGPLGLDVPLRAVSAVQLAHAPRARRRRFSSSVDPVSDRGAHPSGSRSVVVDKILGNQAEAIATRIEQAVGRRRLPSDLAADRDPLEVLAELRALHVAGVISDDEFQARKLELFREI